eukprot:TRINITY_DN3352_c0_g2_i1.p1 TRINITY_DN3352_c0_g2~~TRINITY_DN3352_c0_g2_i1.p1  ORF type:complete len:770 (-),score=145.71 TRINITY_DN3352_c0_g2_i1:487-2721(-)
MGAALKLHSMSYLLLELALAVGAGFASVETGRWQVWRKAADFTHMDLSIGSAGSSTPGVCDPSALAAVHCPQGMWRLLLEELCQHCFHGQCVSDSGLAKLAFEVLHMYASMIVQHGEELLNDFGCKHGLVAALVFHSEHVGFEFRPPQANVELVRGESSVRFQVAAEDHHRLDAAMDAGFWAAGVSPMTVDPKRLTISDKQGATLQFRAGNPGADRYPLTVEYSTPSERAEFLNVRRRFLNDQGHVLMNINLPVMSLSPYPLHTGKLRAMRHISQGDYNQFVADVSGVLSAAGVQHVAMPGDSTALHLSQHFGYLNTSRFLQENFGVNAADGTPDTDGSGEDEALTRSSIFVPLELRGRLVDLLFGASRADGPLGLGRGLRAVELGLGHLQLGEPAYEFARGLNFRVFCERCLWLSFYFYVTEGESLLPAAFWLPCRVPVAEVFPVRHVSVGSAPEVLVPVPRGPLSPAPGLLEKVGAARPVTIYGGSCREALRRVLAGGTATAAAMPAYSSGSAVAPPALPPVLPELLPMHDISDSIDGGTNLDMLMAIKQIHAGPGLEMYNDKIALTREFRRRGLPTPELFYSSYDANFDLRPTIERLERDGIPYVAKASHMCCGMAVFVMEGGVDMLSGKRTSADEIQAALMKAYREPFRQITPRCGDWGTVEAGKTPGSLIMRRRTRRADDEAFDSNRAAAREDWWWQSGAARHRGVSFGVVDIVALRLGDEAARHSKRRAHGGARDDFS